MMAILGEFGPNLPGLTTEGESGPGSVVAGKRTSTRPVTSAATRASARNEPATGKTRQPASVRTQPNASRRTICRDVVVLPAFMNAILNNRERDRHGRAVHSVVRQGMRANFAILADRRTRNDVDDLDVLAGRRFAERRSRRSGTRGQPGLAKFARRRFQGRRHGRALSKTALERRRFCRIAKSGVRKAAGSASRATSCFATP